MPEIKRSALLPYPAGFMYQVVNDVEAYPEFLPWCGGARIHVVDNSSMEASILISIAGIERWFRTCNRLRADESIELTLLDGPFESLEGSWKFVPLADDSCKIELQLNFEMKRGLASAVIAPAFTRIANTLVDSFCARAKELHER